MSRGIVLSTSLNLITEDCCTCGVPFALPTDLRAACLADHSKPFHCPNGHRMYYTGPTDAQKLRDSQARETHLKDQLGAAIREAETTRVILLRDRHRFANGVCPAVTATSPTCIST